MDSLGLGRIHDTICRQMCTPGRYCEYKRRTELWCAVDLNRAALQVDKIAHQGQPDTRSFMRARLYAFNAVEALEYQRQLIFGNTHAGVRDGQRNMVAIAAEFEADLAIQREFERVGKQVENNLFPHRDVDVGFFLQPRAVDLKYQSRPLDGGAKSAGQIGGEGGQIDSRISGIRAAGLNARKIQQGIDQSLQALRVTPQHSGTLLLHRRE